MNHGRTADVIGDPKQLVREFEETLRSMIIPPGNIADARKTITEAADKLRQWMDQRSRGDRDYPGHPGTDEAEKLAFSAFYTVTRTGRRLLSTGQDLFLSILQTSTLPPALRKKVEIANRSYMKVPNPRQKEHGYARHLEMFDIYEKYIKAAQGHLEIAKQAIAKGETHAEEGPGATKMRVGDFTVINTGGFSEKIMMEISDVVQKAQAFLKSAGFSKVCYGAVNASNSLWKSNVAAFYDPSSDEMFIRADRKGNPDVIKTVLHELGHRYEHKFMDKAAIRRLYQTIGGHEYEHKQDVKERKPEPGEKLVSKGKVYIVKTTVRSRNGYKVLLEVPDRPGASASVDLDAYLAMQGEKARNIDENPNYKGYVTDYAKSGGPGENFAEMFAFYCLGRLPVSQTGLFEDTVFGTSKTARERMAHRVTARVLRASLSVG